MQFEFKVGIRCAVLEKVFANKVLDDAKEGIGRNHLRVVEAERQEHIVLLFEDLLNITKIIVSKRTLSLKTTPPFHHGLPYPKNNLFKSCWHSWSTLTDSNVDVFKRPSPMTG